ncbi:NAD(P)-dependent oxidoreductase [Granulosicoccus sp.]|nr:NAD(P)-dependent oxidoreductase [Granulosicoccus sp.]MDB4222638.1 NAD(P)-dependent oxidoreductase [Granulosicoccus sp.]
MNFLTDPFLIPADRIAGPVLVTGAGGCIGAWVCAILSRSDVSVIATDLFPDPKRAALVMGEKEAEALDWIALDVTDGAAVSQLVSDQNVQSIVHLAGLQVPFCAANPAMGARVNVEGTINILEAARAEGIKRTVFASSVAALGFPVGGPNKETLYGAYKVANEHTAYVYWKDWQVPTVCLRPNVVYGVARDQGMTSKSTIAIQAAAFGLPYDVPFTGPYSWLYAGEAAAAFIASISQDGDGAYCFDLNGRCEHVEAGLTVLKSIDNSANVTASGAPIPFNPDLDEAPLRAHVPEYPTISIDEGIKATYTAFKELHNDGQLTSLPA